MRFILLLIPLSIFLTACGGSSDSGGSSIKSPLTNINSAFNLDQSLKVASNDSLSGIWLFVSNSKSIGKFDSEIEGSSGYVYSYEKHTEKAMWLIKISENTSTRTITVEHCDGSSSEMQLDESDTYVYEWHEGDYQDPLLVTHVQSYNGVYTISFKNHNSATGMETVEGWYQAYFGDVPVNEVTNQQAIKISHEDEFPLLNDSVMNVSSMQYDGQPILEGAEDFNVFCYSLVDEQYRVNFEERYLNTSFYKAKGGTFYRYLNLYGKNNSGDLLEFNYDGYKSRYIKKIDNDGEVNNYDTGNDYASIHINYMPVGGDLINIDFIYFLYLKNWEIVEDENYYEEEDLIDLSFESTSATGLIAGEGRDDSSISMTFSVDY